MHTRDFKTDRRLWLYLALGVFVALWFFPWIAFKEAPVRPAIFWPGLFYTLFSPDVPVSQVWEVARFLFWFSLIFSIPSLALGWVLHCVVVILRHRRTDKDGDVAEQTGSG